MLFQEGCDVEAFFTDSGERWRATIYGNFDNGDVQLVRQVDKREERVPRGACRPASARRKRSRAPDAFCPTTAAENQAKSQKDKRRREVEAKAKSAKNSAPRTFFELFAKTKEKRRREAEQKRAEAKPKGAAQQTKRAAAKRKGAAQQTKTTAPKRKRVAPPPKTAYEKGTCNSLSDPRQYEKRVRAPKVPRVCPTGVCTKKTVDFCVCKLAKN